MKINNFKFSVFAVAILALLLPSCSNELDVSNPRIEINLSWEERDIVKSQNSFALSFFREACAANENEGKNVCISPLSLYSGVSMLANGAVGETQKEILDILGIEASSIEEVNRFNRRLLADLATVDKTTEFSLASSVWLDMRSKPVASFLSEMRNSYGADIFEGDLASEASVKDINAWCSGKTKGRIPQFLNKAPGSESINLLNATYFNGKWSSPFKKEENKKMPFYNHGETPVTVDMMYKKSVECSAAYDDNGANWVELNYGNAGYRMYLILPDETSNIGEYFSKLSYEDFKEMTRAVNLVDMELGLPRFTIESEYELDDVLEKMGAELIFNGHGDFSAMMKNGCGAVARTTQKSIIEVNEEGTEAASVTHIIVNPTSPGPIRTSKITFDHPFAFFIMEYSTRSILFMGCVNEL